MQGLRIRCTSCGQTRHETTEHYRSDQTPKGNFVRLIDPWKKWHWNCFDDEGENLSTTPCALMTCPGCSAPLAPDGKLTIEAEPERSKTQAEINQEKMDILFKNDENLIDIVIPIEYDHKNYLICKVCGRACKSNAGLVAHMRSHNV